MDTAPLHHHHQHQLYRGVSIKKGGAPGHECKIVHFIRHGQASHNIAVVENPKRAPEEIYMLEQHADAVLTEVGKTQANKIKTQIDVQAVQLIACSPLRRTLQTALYAFSDVVSTSPASTTQAARPVLVLETLRECYGLHPCDRRNPVSVTKQEITAKFPDSSKAVDFSSLEHNEDVFWVKDVRETDAEVAKRCLKFLDWVWGRNETNIAVVTHHGYLKVLFELLQYENQSDFNNCEVRTVALVKKVS